MSAQFSDTELKDALRPLGQLIEAELKTWIPEFPDGADATSLKDWLGREEPQLNPGYAVYSGIRHVVEAGGKRIRPILTLVASELVCGEPGRAVPTAAGLELLHTFTLVHDDVMDNDLTRRGHPTVHALWGGPLAITAGDGLYAMAFQAIARNAEHPDVSPDAVVRVLADAARVSFDICNGQAQDLLFERSRHVDVAAYREMIRLKTGVLLSYSIEAGARIAGADDATLQALRTYGDHVGLAFQIKDDLLDLVGDEKTIGKPVGSDIRAGKRTLPVLLALQRAEGRDADRLRTILDTPEPDTTATMVAEAIRVLDHTGALEATRHEAEQEIDAAHLALEGITEARSPAAKDLLHAIADYILNRRN